MEAAAIILPIVAGGIGAVGTLYDGSVEAANTKFEAQQLQRNASQQMALAGQAAAEKGREAKLANSANLARAAASGAGASDPTVLQIMGDVEGQAQMDALTEMYKGATRKADLLTQANAIKLAGKRARTSSYIGAAGTLMGGAAGGFSNYNRMK